MGFKLPGKSVHQGTDSHRSAVKAYKHSAAPKYNSPVDKSLVGDQHTLPEHLKDEIRKAPESGDSPGKYAQLALPVLRTIAPRVLPHVAKQVPKVLPNVARTTFKPNMLGKGVNLIKSGYNKLPNMAKNILKQGAIYMGIDTGINMLTGGGSDDSKKSTDTKNNTTTTTPETTTKKKSGPSPYARAKKNDPNLDSYIKERKKHKKGSAEYNALQNKINQAYGVKKRHGVESSSTTKGRKTTSTMNVPGISNTATVTKKRRSGKVKTEKTTDLNTGTTTKRKYTRKGDLKKIVTKKDGKRTVTKKNRKGEVVTKTRKTLNPFD